MRSPGRLISVVTTAVVLFACRPPQPHSVSNSTTRPLVDRVVLISIDGLMPGVYMEPDAHGLSVPTLRRLAREGVRSPGAQPVFPGVTYPSHTTIATGLLPRDHGIVTNTVLDPLGRNQKGWYWYAEDIRGVTLWDAVEADGRHAAIINWPVTVGARVTAVVPELWRAGTREDAKLSRAVSTPGLLEAVGRVHSDFWQRFTPPEVADSATVDVVLYALSQYKPALVMAHIWQTDTQQHRFGPWSPQAKAAIEEADAQLGRIVAELEAGPGMQRSLVVVVSDHGFTTAKYEVRPAVMLLEAGLMQADAEGVLQSWQVGVNSLDGLAMFYLAEGADEALIIPRLRSMFEARSQGADAFVSRVFSREEIAAQGGDSRAVLAVEPAKDHVFVAGHDGPLVRPVVTPGKHGFPPDRPEMRTSLVIWGGVVSPGLVADARLMDVGPTVAHALQVRLPSSKGRVLPVFRN